MRVGIDASPLAARGGGVRRFTEGLIRGLEGAGGDHRFVLFGTKPPQRTLELTARFEWDALHFPFKRTLDQLHLVGAARKLDLYHGTNFELPLLGRLPSVLSVHDLSVELLPETHPRARRLWHLLLPRAVRRATRIVTGSQHTRDALVRHLGADASRIDVVPLAVSAELRPLRPDAPRPRVLEARNVVPGYLLFVGALEPRKNLPTLIDALASLRRGGGDEALVIAGAGAPDYARALERRVRENGLTPGRDVIFTGFVDDAELPALYGAASLFVFPSLHEGFGLPPLEAMACGVPVVFADNTAPAELYRDCGVAVDTSSAEAFAEAIRKTLDDGSLRQGLVERGLERARARSWEDVARDMLGVYRRAYDEAREGAS